MKINIEFEAERLTPELLFSLIEAIDLDDCREMANMCVDDQIQLDENTKVFRPE